MLNRIEHTKFISNPRDIETCRAFMDEEYKALTQEQLNTLCHCNMLLGKHSTCPEHGYGC